MLPGHTIKREQRQLPCCDDPMHWAWVTTCSCGWESNPSADADSNTAIVGHRLDCIEDVLRRAHFNPEAENAPTR